MVVALKARYSQAFADQGYPKWSFEVPPAIPFVGDQFGSAPKRVLVYASAENLNHKDQVVELLNLPDPMLRSGCFLASRRIHDPNSTFVHINPIDNRGLLLAARHALHRLDPQWAFAIDNPASFLDEIAVANLGKFSIDPDKINALRKRNYDYANDPAKFEEMRRYILADLDVLTPDIIIVPKTIARTLRRLDPPIDLAQGRSIVEVYQVSPQAINCHIKRQITNTNWDSTDLSYANWLVTDGRLKMNLYLQWLDRLPDLQKSS